MIIAIIQARMGSSRLPNKVMLDLCKEPVLWHVVNRTRSSKRIERIVVATSENSNNDTIREYCKQKDIECVSGNENDVLDRYYKVMNYANIKDDDIVVRITADCPLIDPELIDEVIERHIVTNSDYTSNTIEPTFPDGLDCEVIQATVLKKAWEEGKLKSEREHVTLYIRNHPELFRIESYKGTEDLSDMRWTLDEEEDYVLIKRIYEELYSNTKMFTTKEILDFLNSDPNIGAINYMHTRNQGLTKSLKEDGVTEEHIKEVNKNG